MDSGLDTFARTGAGAPGRVTARLLLRRVLVALRPRAAKNPGAFRRQIRLQRLPWHEGDIGAFGIGADRISRIMKRQAGAFAFLSRRRQRDRSDLEQFWLDRLDGAGVGAYHAALVLLGFERGDDASP